MESWVIQRQTAIKNRAVLSVNTIASLMTTGLVAPDVLRYRRKTGEMSEVGGLTEKNDEILINNGNASKNFTD